MDFIFAFETVEDLQLSENQSVIFTPGSGYWVSPEGEIIRVRKHIETLCGDPGRFGFDERDLRALFDTYGETWATEGEARKLAIRIAVAERGWIRVRHYTRRPARFSVNLPDLKPPSLNRVRTFFRIITAAGAYDENIVLDAPEGRILGTLREFVDGERTS